MELFRTLFLDTQLKLNLKLYTKYLNKQTNYKQTNKKKENERSVFHLWYLQ
jgi:hypothetical protein